MVEANDVRAFATVLAIVVACAAVVATTAAEALTAFRTRALAGLAFGPNRRPSLWAYAAPLLRVAAQAALAWGFTLLLLWPPKVHHSEVIPENEYRHLLIVLDVSPSMNLVDAGPTQQQSRMHRAADLMKSFFERTPIQLYKVTVVATYNGAIPVVLDTKDMEVIRGIFSDLPMQYAFKPGGTDLFAGLIEAAKIAKPWRPGSATLLVISDGDTTPDTGMPHMPESISHALVVGVGDTQAGRFIEGHHSRQDASTLRQLAVRLNGVYHNGNDKQVSTSVVNEVTFFPGKSVLEKYGPREYALVAIAGGAAVLAGLPVLLWYFGTSWRPGVRKTVIRQADRGASNPRPELSRL